VIAEISAWWIACAGVAITEGPLTGKFTPDLTDRFLMAASVGGALAGANTINPKTLFAETGDYTPTGTVASHTHDMGNHVHTVASHTHDLGNHIHGGTTGGATGTAVVENIDNTINPDSHTHNFTTGGPSTNTSSAAAPGTSGPSTNTSSSTQPAFAGTGVARSAWFKDSASILPAHAGFRAFMLTRHV
jgi:hypothetical protein